MKYISQTLSDSGNLPVVYEISVAEHDDGDDKFWTGNRINVISAHALYRNRQITEKMYTYRSVIPLL